MRCAPELLGNLPDSHWTCSVLEGDVRPTLQKLTFIPNWMIRGLELNATTLPKSLRLISLTGLSRLAWFKMLKKSARKSNLRVSPRATPLLTEKSTLL